MIRILFENLTQKEALDMRDTICDSLKGIPGFINNEIAVNSQSFDPVTNEPTCEDGNMEVITEGCKLHHVVEIFISGNKNDSSITRTIVSKEGGWYFTK